MDLHNILRMPQNFLAFLRELVQKRYVVIELARKDFRSRYLGSYLGLLWAFIHPIVTVVVLWLVLKFGLKLGAEANVFWLVTGMVPWFFFGEGLGSGTSSIVENAQLVKKVVFRVSFLPVVKLLSALWIHLIFLAVLLGIFLVRLQMPTLYWLQLLYYLPAMICLLMSLLWMTSSLAVFARDVGQIVSVAVGLGFWVTPIIWRVEKVPADWQPIIQANPVFYIIQGYRDSLLDHRWFWQHPGQTVYFWCVLAVLLVLGSFVFRRLRPHFADVL